MARLHRTRGHAVFPVLNLFSKGKMKRADDRRSTAHDCFCWDLWTETNTLTRLCRLQPSSRGAVCYSYSLHLPGDARPFIPIHSDICLPPGRICGRTFCARQRGSAHCPLPAVALRRKEKKVLCQWRLPHPHRPTIISAQSIILPRLRGRRRQKPSWMASDVTFDALVKITMLTSWRGRQTTTIHIHPWLRPYFNTGSPHGCKRHAPHVTNRLPPSILCPWKITKAQRGSSVSR